MRDPKVIKTIKNKDIPDDTREKAIEEARLIGKQKLANFSDVEDIAEFAYWEDTPSGHEFWRGISEAGEKKPKKCPKPR
ncbi:unnamed protein product [marine sediment metagenome]|uniref:Uncharacterized protein n=1 Tax=marine sediment metagenome TaxID=412755 RepID=X1JJB1_9ZZZZ